MRALARSRPQINRNVSLTFGFNPNSHVAEPPHVKRLGYNLCAFDLLIEPRSPRGKDLVNPGLSRDFFDI